MDDGFIITFYPIPFSLLVSTFLAANFPAFTAVDVSSYQFHWGKLVNFIFRKEKRRRFGEFEFQLTNTSHKVSVWGKLSLFRTSLSTER